ncbi:MAG: hypothetical protein Q9210_006033 [Variospora velana]
MEDPDLIATLIPADSKEFARSSFLLPSNDARYLKPTKEFVEGPTISSRQSTPGLEAPNEACYEYETAHRIQLRFDGPPKDPASGFAFGTDPQRSDVLLNYRGVVPGVSGHHFNITFNEGGHLILKGLSTRGTSVSYDGQAEDTVRHRFTWMLDLPKEEGKRDVKVHVPNKDGLVFKVN